jgi:hypothetical protein
MFPSTSANEILYECVLSASVLYARPIYCFCQPVQAQETEDSAKRAHGLLAGPICISDEWIRVPFETDLHNLYNVHENTAAIKLLGDQRLCLRQQGNSRNVGFCSKLTWLVVGEDYAI